MLPTIKNLVNKAFGDKDEIDVILSMPITQLRLELKKSFDNKSLDAEGYESFVKRLIAIEDLSSQAAIAKQAAVDRKVNSTLDIELNTEAKQLLWAATLTHMMHTGEEPLARSELWSQLKGTIGVYNEGISIANVISASLQNDEVTFDWGQPGSWFYRDPRKNHMNFDLYYMLLAGFEHTRAVALHEMGHSDLSVAYPPSMQKLYEKVFNEVDVTTSSKNNNQDPNDPAPNAKKAKKPRPKKMTKQEQIDLAAITKEWNLRQRSWNSMEDITVDQYAINMSARFPQDFKYSMNHAATDLRGYAEILMGDDLKMPVTVSSDIAPDKVAKRIKDHQAAVKRATSPLSASDVADVKAGKISHDVAYKVYTEIERATLLAGYVKQGLFRDNPKNWERFRVFIDDINNTVDVSKVPGINGRTAFQYLCDICADGENSIRLLQPKASDRFIIRPGYNNLADSYRGVVKETNAKRNMIMEEIWDVYLKPFADVLIEDFKNKIEENLDKKQNQQKQKNQNGQGGNSQSQGNGGGGDGDPSSGGSGGETSDDPMDMDGDLESEIDDMSENPEEGRSKQNDISNGKSAGQDQKNEDGAGGQDQEAGGKDDQAKDSKSGGGADEDAEEKNEGQSSGKGNKPGRGWDQDDEPSDQQPQRVGDVKNKSKADDKPLTDDQKKQLNDKINQMDRPDPDSMVQKAGKAEGIDFEKLAKGSWSNFNHMMLELAPVVNLLAQSYIKIREEQKRQISQMSHNHDFMAEDGDIIDRLDRDKVLNTKFRQATGQQLTTDDFQKFKQDTVKSIYSTIEIAFLIDGSSSMVHNTIGNGVTAMEAALLSSAIGYMACRKAGIDAYIIMWGDSKPRIIADPTTDVKEVGRRLDAVRKGINSGTDLAPGLLSTFETMARHKNKNGTISGSSHVLIHSDGDIADPAEAQKMLESIVKNSHNVSVDVAVLKDGEGKTAMENTFDEVVKKYGDRTVSVIRGNDPKIIPLELARNMQKRVRKIKIKTEPDEKKRDRLKSLVKKMKI